MPQQQAEYMTCTPLRINAKFLLHRGRRPYMSLSKDGRIWPSGKREEIGATRRNGGEVGGFRHCSVTGP